MSADNFIYVKHKKNVGFVVLDNLSASIDYTRRQLNAMEPLSVHKTLEEALLAAHELERRRYYEYGVRIDHLLDLSQASAGRSSGEAAQTTEGMRASES